MKPKSWLLVAASLLSWSSLFSQSIPFLSGVSSTPLPLKWLSAIAYAGKGMNTIETAANLGIIVYPNPVSTALSVSMDNGSLGFKQFRVFNAGGRLVFQETAGNSSQDVLNIIDLAKGSYYLAIDLSDGTAATQSFFKK